MGTWEVYSEKKKYSTLGKKSRFGHTSFIKVVINGTITNNRSKTPHDSIENTGCPTTTVYSLCERCPSIVMWGLILKLFKIAL